MKSSPGLALLLVVVGAAPAVAQASWYNGLYFGGGVGAGRIEADMVELGLMPERTEGDPPVVINEPIESSKFKKTSLTADFFVGYRFARYFAIEGGFTKLYDVDRQYCFVDDEGVCIDANRGGSTSTGDTAWTVELPTDGWTAFAVGLLPFGANDAFDLFVKIGAIAWETEAAAYEAIVGNFVPSANPAVPPGNPPISRKLDGTDLAAGAGINFNHPSGVTIRSELEYFDISEYDQSFTFTVSAVYNF